MPTDKTIQKNSRQERDQRLQQKLHSYKGHVPKVNETEPPELKNVATLQNVKTLSDKKITLDENRACWYLNLKPTEDERKVDDLHVQLLLDQMKMGLFLWDNVIIGTAKLNGVTHKLNGQHTSWAVIFMQDAEPGYSGKVREIQYQVNNQQELIALYRTYDSALSTRSQAHITTMAVAEIPQLKGIPRGLLNPLTSATMFWRFESKHERRRHMDVQRREVVEKNIVAVEKMARFFHKISKEAPHLRRSPVMAAMVGSFDKVATKAPEFWQPVADGLGLNKSDPRYRLREYLQKTVLHASRGSQRDPVDAETMYRVCVNCWNKWRQGKLMQMTPRSTDDRVALR